MNDSRPWHYHENDKRFVLAGKALSVTTPCVMGVLNVTPDSFYDGGAIDSVQGALDRISEMVSEGADIIDIGGESTRPGSDPITGDEELGRVIPVLEKAISQFPQTMFSIDTTRFEVARVALECGVDMVNDVSGLQKEVRLADLCAENNAILVIMHSRGDPKTMQIRPVYKDVVQDISSFLIKKKKFAKKRGVQQIIVDPGIGFGKNLRHNLEIIARLNTFKEQGDPVLMGLSRKSMIGKILAGKDGDRPVGYRLAGTTALHYHALMHGADILRVHDVQEAKDTIEVYKAVSWATFR